MNHRTLNLPVLLGSLLVFVGFCCGWFGMWGQSASGWDVASTLKEGSTRFYLVYSLPLLSLLAAGLACCNRKAAGKLALGMGAGFLLWGTAEVVIQIVRLVTTTTSVGLWATIAGLVILALGGLFSLAD